MAIDQNITSFQAKKNELESEGFVSQTRNTILLEQGPDVKGRAERQRVPSSHQDPRGEVTSSEHQEEGEPGESKVYLDVTMDDFFGMDKSNNRTDLFNY